ncbi:hypothetical protein [Sulfitobacter sp. 1A12157]
MRRKPPWLRRRTNAISYDSWPVPLVSAVAKTGGVAKHAPMAHSTHC